MKKGINFKMKSEHAKGYTSCFLLEDALETCIVANEEFYNIPVPSEDIWKKFELLPTPPRSPTRDLGPDDPTEAATERLLRVTNLLDDNADGFQLSVGVSDFYSGLLPAQVQVGLKNDLLHDCMWSGQCTESCKKKNAHNRIPNVNTSTPLAVCGRPTTPSSGTVVNPGQCVDPSSVLPYTPLSDHSYHQATRLAARAALCSETTRIQPPTPLREHLGSDTPSDSDDEDDEIDVVGYAPKPVLKKKKQIRRGASHLLSLRVTPESRPAKRPCDKTRLNEGKKSREDKLKRNVYRYSSSSRSSSSDSEDCEKRSQHNSMERKRRDDLRYAFQTLRENVPDLKDNPKAPKILILNQAATYVHQLTTTGQNLEQTLKQETKRRHELQRRLLQLQRTKF